MEPTASARRRSPAVLSALKVPGGVEKRRETASVMGLMWTVALPPGLGSSGRKARKPASAARKVRGPVASRGMRRVKRPASVAIVWARVSPAAFSKRMVAALRA